MIIINIKFNIIILWLYFGQYELTEREKAEVNNGILEQTQEQSLTEFTKWTKSIRVNAQYKVFTRICDCVIIISMIHWRLSFYYLGQHFPEKQVDLLCYLWIKVNEIHYTKWINSYDLS